MAAKLEETSREARYHMLLAEKLEAERDALRDLVTEAYPGDHPTNGWRLRAEKLGAWPPRVVERPE